MKIKYKILVISFLSFVFIYINTKYLIYHFFKLLDDGVFLISIVLFDIIYIIVTFYLYNLFQNYVNKINNRSNLNNILYNLFQKSSNFESNENLYAYILEAAIESISIAEKGSIMLLQEDMKTLKFAAAYGYDFDTLKTTYLLLEESYLYRESKGDIKGPVVIDDPFGYDRKNFKSEHIKKVIAGGSDEIMSTISTPIIYNNELHGMINVDSSIRYGYKSDDVKIIEIFAHEISNVLKIYQTNNENAYLSTHDVLTGIYNRTYFKRYFDRILDEKLLDEFVFISMDINNLKITNDTFGHEAGDLLIKQFVQGFKVYIPNDSCFARVGGDEFIIILNNIDVLEINSLLENVQLWHSDNPVRFEDSIIEVKYSSGIVVYPKEETNKQRIINLADSRMYANKKVFKLAEK